MRMLHCACIVFICFNFLLGLFWKSDPLQFHLGFSLRSENYDVEFTDVFYRVAQRRAAVRVSHVWSLLKLRKGSIISATASRASCSKVHSSKFWRETLMVGARHTGLHTKFTKFPLFLVAYCYRRICIVLVYSPRVCLLLLPLSRAVCNLSFFNVLERHYIRKYWENNVTLNEWLWNYEYVENYRGNIKINEKYKYSLFAYSRVF